MRHFSSRVKQKRRRLNLWANKELNTLLDRYLKEHEEEIRRQFLEGGISEEKLDESIAELREKVQIDMIKQFKIELRAKRAERRVQQQVKGKRARTEREQKDAEDDTGSKCPGGQAKSRP